MNVLNIDFEDGWRITTGNKYHCKYGRYIIDPSIELMVLFVFIDHNHHWTMNIFYPNIKQAIESFYSTEIKYKFDSAEEAKLYFDTFVNKYNILKIFL